VSANVRTIRLPRPLKHQRAILLSGARFKVVCAGRRFGKTLLGLVAVLGGHGPLGPDGRPLYRGAAHGAAIWWIAPTFAIAGKIWRDVKAALRDWGGELAKNEVERRIDFPSGGSLTIKSAHEPDALRGEGLDGIVVDEAAFVPETAWTLALRPALADRRGWAIFISTPSGRNWFHVLHEAAPKTDGWECWTRPTSANPTIAPAELEAARTSLGAAAFAREFEASFDAGTTGLISRASLQFYDGLPELPVRFASADLAISTKSSSDWTVVALFGRQADGRLYLLDLFRDRVEGARIVALLSDLARKWNAQGLVLEGGGPLGVLNAQARAAGLPVVEVPHGNKDKLTRAQPLAAALEHGRLLLPRVATWLAALVDELCSFPSLGAKDDQVDALALGVAAFPPFRAKAKPAPPVNARQAPDPWLDGYEVDDWATGGPAPEARPGHTPGLWRDFR
jgi:predicted phage terminase large subunit-like protein